MSTAPATGSAARSGSRPAHPGKAIRAARESLGLTLDELAERAGCSPSYLSRVERGQRNPTRYFRDHVSRVLADALLDGAAS